MGRRIHCQLVVHDGATGTGPMANLPIPPTTPPTIAPVGAGGDGGGVGIGDGLVGFGGGVVGGVVVDMPLVRVVRIAILPPAESHMNHVHPKQGPLL